MKNVVRTLCALIVAALLMLLGGMAGFESGIRHVMKDSELWILEFDEPEDGDVYIHMLLDGNDYILTCTVG